MTDHVLLAVRSVQEPSLWQGKLLAVLTLLLLIGVPILVIRGHRRMAGPRGRAKFYKGLTDIRRDRVLQPGDVNLVFHTYAGFLVTVMQTRHDVVLPAEQARVLLRRLAKHNLTYGLFAAGAVFIPLLTLAEYWTQSVKIAKAARRGFDVTPLA